MDNNGMTLADIAAVVRDKDGCWGDGGGIWVLILLLFLIGGGNGLGIGGNAALTTTDALINTNFNNLDSNVQSIANRQYEQANNLTKGICELGNTLLQGQAGINANIAASQYAVSQAIAADGQQTRAEIRGLSEMMYQNKIDTLQAEVNDLKYANNNQLQTQEITAGILNSLGRYVTNPPCYQNVCCNS